jgi:hypothetical protein
MKNPKERENLKRRSQGEPASASALILETIFLKSKTALEVFVEA